MDKASPKDAQVISPAVIPCIQQIDLPGKTFFRRLFAQQVRAVDDGISLGPAAGCGFAFESHPCFLAYPDRSYVLQDPSIRIRKERNGSHGNGKRGLFPRRYSEALLHRDYRGKALLIDATAQVPTMASGNGSSLVTSLVFKTR